MVTKICQNNKGKDIFKKRMFKSRYFLVLSKTLEQKHANLINIRPVGSSLGLFKTYFKSQMCLVFLDANRMQLQREELIFISFLYWCGYFCSSCRGRTCFLLIWPWISLISAEHKWQGGTLRASWEQARHRAPQCLQGLPCSFSIWIVHGVTSQWLEQESNVTAWPALSMLSSESLHNGKGRDLYCNTEGVWWGWNFELDWKGFACPEDVELVSY